MKLMRILNRILAIILVVFMLSPIEVFAGESIFLMNEDKIVYPEALIVSMFEADNVKASVDEQTVDEELIFSFIVHEMKLNEAAACGILANIRRESGFNPGAHGDRDENGIPTSFGLCQWHSERYQRLITWCEDNGFEYTTLLGQVNYLKYELENFYKSTLNYLKAVPNTSEGAYLAGYNWCYTFERPSNLEYNSQRSGMYARDLYWPRYSPLIMDADLSWEEGYAWGEVKTTKVKPNETENLRIVKEEYTYKYFHFHNHYDGSRTMIDSIPYVGNWGYCEFITATKMVDFRNFEDQGGRTVVYKGNGTRCTCSNTSLWFEDIEETTYYYQVRLRATEWGELKSTSLKPQQNQLLKIEAEEPYYTYFHYHNEYDGSNTMLDSIAYDGFYAYCEFTTNTRLTREQSFEDQGGRTRVRRGAADRCQVAGRDIWFEDKAFTIYYYRTREFLPKGYVDMVDVELLSRYLSEYDYDNNIPRNDTDLTRYDLDEDDNVNLKDLLQMIKEVE